MATYKPGSFILFKRNIRSLEQIRTLNQSLYSESFKTTSLPPLLAVDQEGGSVSRLPINPPPPNAFALGQTHSPLLVEEMGHQTGLFLRAVGFNMNLAPVLDVVDVYSPGFIGVRSFGADPQHVGEMGVAFSRGLLKSKVLPTAKHFPGTGNITLDPHKTVVTNQSTKEQLMSQDVLPFTHYARITAPTAVMLSHLVYPHLDPSNEPASYSKAIISNLLRDEMNYQGLVITDDLQMSGAKMILRPEEAALKSLKAGSDMVMLTWSFADQVKAFQRVKKAVQSGELSEKEVHDKLYRILVAKAMTHSYRSAEATPFIQNQTLSSKDYMGLEEEVLQSNLKEHLLPRSLPAKGDSRLPANAEVSSPCVLSPSQSFLKSFSDGYKGKFFARQINGADGSAVLSDWIHAQRCPSVVFNVTGPASAKMARALPAKVRSKTVVVNLGAPRLLRSEKGYFRVIQLYFSHSQAGKKIAQHLNEILQDSSSSYAIK